MGKGSTHSTKAGAPEGAEIPMRIRPTRRMAVLLATGYAVVALVWVVGLGTFLRYSVQDRELRASVQYFQRTLFVVASATLLGVVLDWYFREIRRATEQARESEARYRQALDNMMEGCQILGFDWEYLYLNDTALRHSRRPRVDLLGKRFVDLWPGIRETEAFAAMKRCMEERKPQRLETLFRYADGQGVWFDLSIQPVVEGVFILSIDITERKRAEVALRQWADAFENCGHGISMVVPGENRILACNPALARLLGRTVEELAGCHVLEVYDPDDHGRILEWVAEADRVGQVRYETRMVRRDGSRFPVQADVVSVRDPRGVPVYRVATVHDITERKRAYRIVRESEERLRSLMKTSFDWFWEVDDTGRYTQVSGRVSELLGYTPDEVLGKTPFDFMPEEEARRVGEVFRDLMVRRAPVVHLENTNRHKDGRLVVLETSAVPVLGVSGELLGYRGMDRDITERKRSERLSRIQLDLALALAAGGGLEDGLRLCLQAAIEAGEMDSGGIYLLDEKTGTFDLAVHRGLSGRFAELASVYDPGSAQARMILAGKPVVGRLSDFGWPLPEVVRSEGLRVVAVIPLRHEGTVVGSLNVGSHVVDTLHPMPLEALETIAAKAVQAMVRLRTEAALRQSEQRFRTLVDNAPIGLFLQVHGRFAYVNRAAERIFGSGGSGCLLGAPILERFHPDRHPAVGELLRRLLEEHQPIAPCEERCMRVDGTEFSAEFSAAPFAFDGQPGALVFLADITERKALETQFRQAQKLEAVGQLAGGVAHDFNNILAAMMMHLGLLQIDSRIGPEAQAALEELDSEARRAASLTRQLLMFSRRSVLTTRVLDLNEVVVNLLKMLGRLIGENIQLGFEGASGLPAVEADAGMLEQVLMNFVVNARDAMPRGGHITIATRLVGFDSPRLGAHPDRRLGRFVCLSVADQGTGMDPETLKRIFEPFFTTKDPGQGTGLGLATVHGIVAQHKGWVEVESAPGRGSTFLVYLPAVDASLRETAQANVPEPLLRGSETILLVEDDEGVRRQAGKTLRVLGYRVYEASNGREAMAVWQVHGEDVDLLLTDMVMPEGMTGLELAERLQSLRFGLKVIIASGYSAEVVQAGIPRREGLTYLSKPFPMYALAKAVRESLDALG